MPQIILDFWKAADSSKGAKKDKYSTQAIDSVLGHGKYKKLPVRQGLRLLLRRQPSRQDASTTRARPTTTRRSSSPGASALTQGQVEEVHGQARPPLQRHLPVHPDRRGKNDLELSRSRAPAKAAGTRAVVTI